MDQITLLSSFGPILAKRWTARGIQPYDRAKHFRAEVVDVRDIRELSGLLTSLERMPQTCVIRGLPRSTIDSSKTTRDLDSFYEAPHHWVCIDVDDWIAADPILDPEGAVRAFIEAALPAPFHVSSCHWQLSNSAGAPGKEGLLKAHLWFWLERPYGEVELTAWARSLNLPIDHTVFRTVQVHYTASPVIEEGVSCPVTKRSGFIEGMLGDEVPLLIDPAVVGKAYVERSGRKEMVDPTEKAGVVGAFCRAYPPERAIEELLSGHFEWEGEDGRRLTWLRGGGAPGGAVITDDGQHVYNSHSTDPAGGRATNTFDLCRIHLFGDLDAGAEPDTPVNALPSYIEMSKLARSLPDVAEDLASQRTTADEDFGEFVDDSQPVQPAPPGGVTLREQEVLLAINQIATAPDVSHLEHVVCAGLRNQSWTGPEIARLVGAVRDRFHDLTGTRLSVGDARRMLPAASSGGRGAPSWLERWVLVESNDKLFCLDDKALVSRIGFSNRHVGMAPAKQNGGYLDAWEWVRENWEVRRVFGVAYGPGQPEVFEALDRHWANTYRESSVPQTAPSANHPAVEAVRRHLARVFPDERERALLVSWLAHQVRSPGSKVRWAPFIYGAQGTGKTFLAEMMSRVLGPSNVRVVSGTTLRSDFNSWVNGAALVVIEEVYQVGHRFDVAEKLKGPIANDIVDVHRKGQDAYSAPNFSNYLLLSNHPDAIPIDHGDRRYLVLETAITTAQAKELSAEGYFNHLFRSIQEPGAAGALRRWLIDEPAHPEFDPHGRAPQTKTLQTVIELSRDEVEQAIVDAVGDRRAFTFGWLKNVLSDEHGVRLPGGRGAAHALRRVGFIQADYSPIKIEGKATRVYVREEDQHANPDQLRDMLGIPRNENEG